MKHRFGLSLMIVGILLASQLGSAFADTGNDNIDDTSQYATWGDQFWEYAFSLSQADFNQFLVNGDQCVTTNQNYEVFFLSGIWGSGSAKRTCTIEAGTRLFFPLINNVYGEDPKYYDASATPAYVPSTFISWFDQNFSRANRAAAYASLDGVSLVNLGNQKRYYVTSDLENAPTVTWPGYLFVDGNPIVYQNVQGGYYLSLKLKPRNKPYILKFGGTISKTLSFTTTFTNDSQWVKDGFPNPYTVTFYPGQQDITYTITVK